MTPAQLPHFPGARLAEGRGNLAARGRSRSSSVMVTLGGLTPDHGFGFRSPNGSRSWCAFRRSNDAQWHDAFAKYQLIRNTASKITA